MSDVVDDTAPAEDGDEYDVRSITDRQMVMLLLSDIHWTPFDSEDVTLEIDRKTAELVKKAFHVNTLRDMSLQESHRGVIASIVGLLRVLDARLKEGLVQDAEDQVTRMIYDLTHTGGERNDILLP
tara:strand:+ start:908 stop:1285 length:378 start_codon:yes stop_codon:yes gene_type:complete